ncbi:MAG: acyl-CoA dehydratase activase-related protein [Prevotella sp.]|jgi:predicted CoA-substrate-specific enzyme activase
MKRINIGFDIGSTTAKVVALDSETGELVFDVYHRHQAKVKECLTNILHQLGERVGEAELSVCITGSVGMGFAERYGLPFVQEVVSATEYLKKYYPQTRTLIDIGGEDAKMIFLKDGHPTDLRMNGNCAGGTGAFIDQMAVLLDTTPEEMGHMAEKSTQLYPIASRCGVFCKTDIQNLMARNADKNDIARSIFHAVSVQTVVTLAHGHDIKAPVLLCGGPLTFIPSLRKAFADYLQLKAEDFIVPEKSHLIPAWGAALAKNRKELTLSGLEQLLQGTPKHQEKFEADQLPPLFHSSEEYEDWKSRKHSHAMPTASLKSGKQQVVMGIDSGSTTTKIVVLDTEGRMIYHYYHDNEGNPVGAVTEGLRQLQTQCKEAGCELEVVGSCSTGYGEDLVKAAFRLRTGIIETMAHYMAASHITKDVSFILDIGGQDMKAIFVDGGVINRIEVNEACSSGCGSFISTFARSLNTTVSDFAQAACRATRPSDLGTRCTVFMNSKVKQVLREGASMEDIAAGLSYSVVKNCLYKVLRLKSVSELGDKIVVQGGTMRNDSIVRALEVLTGTTVYRSDCPELMGAIGCALYALSMDAQQPLTLQEMIDNARYTSRQLHCHGCVNQCTVTRYRFANDNSFFSGNRCEKVFNNKGTAADRGRNAYESKTALLFDRAATERQDPERFTIGIPRCLNMFEDFPFWHTLFTECGIQVVLSEVSNFTHYEQCAGKVMSDNICFPAKLVHSHIDDLVKKGVDRIFMPFTVFENRDGDAQNSYDCPIVTGYSQVVRSVQGDKVPVDAPSISMKSDKSLLIQCKEYLSRLGIDAKTVEQAFAKAREAQQKYEHDIRQVNEEILKEAREKHKTIILLAGRPYHADPLIQHKVSEMIAALGAYVISDDIVRGSDIQLKGVNHLSQWAFPDRILKAVLWTCMQDDDVQLMQLTSFGCGPDAFLVDEVRSLLKKAGKNLTLLKIDDVNNIGSLKLRVRSLLESLRIGIRHTNGNLEPDATLPPFTREERSRKIIMPFFTPFISPLIPPLMKMAGYDAESLPMADADSVNWGLKSSNNEICYPATLIVGDIVKAFRSGRYDPDKTSVIMTQTGGQCRASNYIPLIRKALIENGYTNTPVISVATGSGIENNQPGFKINWFKMIGPAVNGVLFSDVMAKMYHAAVVRERTKGEAAEVCNRWMEEAKQVIYAGHTEQLYDIAAKAAVDFDNIIEDCELPRVGIVGEIFLKFHPFAQKHVVEWLEDHKIEVVYPMLSDFFLQGFVNAKDNHRKHIEKKSMPEWLITIADKLITKRERRFDEACSAFRRYVPFESIYEKAKLAQPVINLSAQFGEGWLIAGEVASLARKGVRHAVSLQPFGCIANHIVSKGIENRLRQLYPQLNILSLDFDSSVSEVNIANRLLLFINDMYDENQKNGRKEYRTANHTSSQSRIH